MFSNTLIADRSINVTDSRRVDGSAMHHHGWLRVRRREAGTRVYEAMEHAAQDNSPAARRLRASVQARATGEGDGTGPAGPAAHSPEPEDALALS